MYAGILNVQWNNNYGAVLIAYSMQKKLEQLNVKNEIINYFPSKLNARGEIPSCHPDEK